MKCYSMQLPMTKKTFLYLALVLMPMTSFAQQATSVNQQVNVDAQPVLRFGYFSYDEVFHTMPGYAIAKHDMDDLRIKYDEETKRSEQDFNAKYEEFLAGQRNFVPSILNKRQQELRELMEKNIAFKAESQRLLKQAEEEAYAPLKAQIQETLSAIGEKKGYAFILNTDNNSTPYINKAMGEDITQLLLEKLK